MWIYNDREINSHEDLEPLCTNIVYMIKYKTGQMYIGKRTVRSMSTLPALKTKRREDSTLITRHILRDEDGNIITSKVGRREARKRGLTAKAERYEKVLTDKPFMDYCGSHECDLEIDYKEILHQCTNKLTATYLEEYLLFALRVLFTDRYLNENIGGRYFDNALEGIIKC